MTEEAKVYTNNYWAKWISVTNTATFYLILSILIFVDTPILISVPALAPFFIAMLLFSLIFWLIKVYENKTLSPAFIDTKSGLDGWIYFLIIIRNICFVIAVVPLIQIFGIIFIILGFIPYSIIYLILINKRKNITNI